MTDIVSDTMSNRIFAKIEYLRKKKNDRKANGTNEKSEIRKNQLKKRE